MDKEQLYNQSAMLHDALSAKANETRDQNERANYEQLASDQQGISDRLKPNQTQAQSQQQNQAQSQQQQNPNSPTQ
jgi:hypothetical protein